MIMGINIFRFPIYNKNPDEITKELMDIAERRIDNLVQTGLERNYAMQVNSIITGNKFDIDNYIIGYLYVDYQSGCFSYRLAICKRKNSNSTYKMPPFTETKHYMEEQHISGYYSPAYDKNNEEIANMLRVDINLICRNYIVDAYCDLSSFKLLNSCIDYNKLLSSLDNK